MALTAIYKYPDNGYKRPDELTVGEEYNVRECHMGQSYTNIWIEGHPFSFNSVNFDFYKDGKPHNIFKDPEYNPYIRRKRDGN